MNDLCFACDYNHPPLTDIHHFVHPVKENFLCPCCRKLLFVPVSCVNHHVTCAKCIRGDSVTPTCGICPESVHYNMTMEDAIANLQVRCPHASCTWKGMFGHNGHDLHTHMITTCVHRQPKTSPGELRMKRIKIGLFFVALIAVVFVLLFNDKPAITDCVDCMVMWMCILYVYIYRILMVLTVAALGGVWFFVDWMSRRPTRGL